MSASTDLCDLGIQLRQLDLSSKFEKTWAPMAPAPKPLPKPQPLSLSHSQATNQQAQQHQQLAQHLHRAISQSNAQQRIYPQPPTPTLKAVTSKEPMTNGYDERDKVSDVEQLYRFSPTSSQAASFPIS
jgi:hypothetical protein